jgi:hypothetical protein
MEAQLLYGSSGGCVDVWSGLALILSRWSLIGLEVVLAGSYGPCCQQPRPRPPRIQDVPGARSPTVSRTTKGAVGIGCSRSHGSRRPSVCGKSPTEIAFAVHLWAPGNRTHPRRRSRKLARAAGPIILGDPISQDDHNGTLRCRPPRRANKPLDVYRRHRTKSRAKRPAASVRRTTAATASGKRQDVNGGHGSGNGKRQAARRPPHNGGKRQSPGKRQGGSG